MENDPSTEAFTEKYLLHLDGMDMSLEQKREYIKDLSKIMKTFVDKAWESTK
jgi:hypothetical protein